MNESFASGPRPPRGERVTSQQRSPLNWGEQRRRRALPQQQEDRLAEYAGFRVPKAPLRQAMEIENRSLFRRPRRFAPVLSPRARSPRLESIKILSYDSHPCLHWTTSGDNSSRRL